MWCVVCVGVVWYDMRCSPVKRCSAEMCGGVPSSPIRTELEHDVKSVSDMVTVEPETHIAPPSTPCFMQSPECQRRAGEVPGTQEGRGQITVQWTQPRIH